MYRPKGLCLNDFDISYNPFKKRYELIHLQGPPLATNEYDATKLETSYGFATSENLVDWKGMANVFGITEDFDVFDDSAVWTMQTLFNKDHSKRLMFYTGLNKSVHFQQKIGLAEYDFETESWNKYQKNPIVEADPRWYQTEGLMAWRDPYVVWDEENGTYRMFICAKVKDEPERTNGCIAMATSDNLHNWQVCGPVLAPSRYSEIECPVYYQRGKFHYLITSVSDTNSIHVWRAEKILGPYEEQGILSDRYHYAPRIISYQGRDVLLHTQWIERPDQTGAMIASRGYLADPKVIHQDEDGILSISPLNA